MTTCPGNCARCTLATCALRSSGKGDRDARTRSRSGAGPSAPVPRDDLGYLFDGTLEGFFSSVFAAYEHHEHPRDIVPEKGAQLSLLQRMRTIETDDARAMRVHDGLVHQLGSNDYERVKVACLSDDVSAFGTVYRYIVYALHAGSWAASDHTHPDVAAFDHVWRAVYNERHRMLQFARFAEMEGGVYYAKINPRANVLPLVMQHFAARFNAQPFLIYDEVHRIAGVSRDGRWELVKTDGVTPGLLSSSEVEYQNMWKEFYDAICNQERLNPRLRASFMRKSLWGNLVEMNPLASRRIQDEFDVHPAAAQPSGAPAQTSPRPSPAVARTPHARLAGEPGAPEPHTDGPE